MSFSNEIKQEILGAKWTGAGAKEAQAYGLFAFGHAFLPGDVSLRTENREVAALYRNYLRRCLGPDTPVVFEPRRIRGRELYHVALPEERDCGRLLDRFGHGRYLLRDRFAESGRIGAFLSGAYLACGNATDPQKGYHLEFVTRSEALACDLWELLEGTVRGAKQFARRGEQVVYYKECVPIEDLLTLMGASKSSLAMIEVEIFKNVRNRAMRATNCETANIDKLVHASTAQIADIELVLRTVGLDSLPEPLREAALVRMENPELSLRELAGAFPQPLSRSGVHHRLDKLQKMATQIRGQQKEGSANE